MSAKKSIKLIELTSDSDDDKLAETLVDLTLDEETECIEQRVEDEEIDEIINESYSSVQKHKEESKNIKNRCESILRWVTESKESAVRAEEVKRARELVIKPVLGAGVLISLLSDDENGNDCPEVDDIEAFSDEEEYEEEIEDPIESSDDDVFYPKEEQSEQEQEDEEQKEEEQEEPEQNESEADQFETTQVEETPEAEGSAENEVAAEDESTEEALQENQSNESDMKLLLNGEIDWPAYFASDEAIPLRQEKQLRRKQTRPFYRKNMPRLLRIERKKSLRSFAKQQLCERSILNSCKK